MKPRNSYIYLAPRAAFLRNVIVSAVNGSITLILLLIAPLGLAAVILNTILVTISTWAVCMIGDWVIFWLLASSETRDFLKTNDPNFVRFDKSKEIDKINPKN